MKRADKRTHTETNMKFIRSENSLKDIGEREREREREQKKECVFSPL